MLENSQKETPLTGEALTDFLANRSKELAIQTDKFGPGTFGRVVTDNAALLLQNDSADDFGAAVSLVIEGIRSNPELASKYATDLQGFETKAETASVTKDPNTLSPTELQNMWNSGARFIEYNGQTYPLENPGG